MQERSKLRGFSSGVPGGRSGAGAEAAVMALQRSKAMLASGRVRPSSWAALVLVDAAAAGWQLATFVKDKERALRQTLFKDDLRHVRRPVNGGSHGPGRPADAYCRGQARWA